MWRPVNLSPRQLGAESFYHVGGHGHGEKHAYGYAIEVEEEEIVDEAEEVIDFAALMEDADVSKGAKVWGKCKACHKLEDGANAQDLIFMLLSIVSWF